MLFTIIKCYSQLFDFCLQPLWCLHIPVFKYHIQNKNKRDYHRDEECYINSVILCDYLKFICLHIVNG